MKKMIQLLKVQKFSSKVVDILKEREKKAKRWREEWNVRAVFIPDDVPGLSHQIATTRNFIASTSKELYKYYAFTWVYRN